ncbi:RICIN domain-containing protein [Kitasatospora sp. NPDC057198]|uniref:RICIN domain-containing protein n=1 Tax=Kitasatospora sp. NPDC057198 TaxID=3346046 RepID=UPI003629EBFD
MLADYPEPERSQVLDYLFKPGYGAALQLLKVEVGGDTNSTDGAEASIEHARGSVDCSAGYEWWLMEQARARNPQVKLAALSWGAPGWIGNGNFWSQDMVDYLLTWLDCAGKHHLTIDYLGGWNERGYDAAWYGKLRAALNAHGYASVKVVGADSFGWDLAGAMHSDAALDRAVDVVGVHYPCGYLSAADTCPSSPDAQALGKPLWASENGSQDIESGAVAMARAINRGYLDGKMTAFVNWPVVAALYPNLFFHTDGLVTADQPWSGAYRVGRSAWVTAQTTQFTAPGWQYLDPASGYLGGDRANGSYVTLAAPDRTAWSTVVETTGAGAPQTLTLHPTGSLPGGALHVWTTDLNAAEPRMARAADLTPVDGTYTATLQPDRVYTFTTTTGQAPGTAVRPDRAPLPLPYTDALAHPAGREARYLATMNGAFQEAPCAGGRAGTCLRQNAPVQPIRWTDEKDPRPYALLGDLSWSNYTVSADVLLEQAGSAEILGRAGSQGRNNGGLDAYRLSLADTGAWQLVRTDTAWNTTVLARGSVRAPGTGTWHRLALGFQGSTLTAAIDGTRVGTATDTALGGGLVGLGTDGYHAAQYANLFVAPGTPAAVRPGTYRLVNAASGKLLDAAGGGTADGTPVVQWSDDGGTNQQWKLAPAADGFWTITGAAAGKVLDVPGRTALPGTPLDLWTGDGGANQQWLLTPDADGTYVVESRATGHVLDVSGGSAQDGAQALQWYRNGGANQRWKLVPVS